jgi:peptidoglycan biosynthesis protein MviN/MurJ (putative lipid II flippase)
MFISLFTISLNIVLAYFLAKPYNYGVAGLAIAQSIVAFVEVMILFAVMIKRDHKLLDSEFFHGILRIISVTGFTLIAGYIMLQFYPLGALDRGVSVLGGKLMLITVVVFAVHVGVSALFGLDEVRPVLRRAKQLIVKPVRLLG